ncbi:hypothetical protein FGLOB1_3326 [Fusarium globosum]|uniref:Uncharacterized protein n=1 Tax=Fusarium globosum TaxID=78864 RepID=A0A8H6DFB5_9HYPO|nr:hypothetical protein FGLOB1_3326 [Fusarium globosum]
MLDIGRARRKPSKDHQFVTLTWQAQKHTGKQESPKRRHYGHSKIPEKFQFTISTPRLYALAVFEREWGEDSFSAYGFTLIMTTGQNAMSGTYLTNTFWSPFAFRKSAFLKHYQQIFSSPEVLVPLYRQSSLELKAMALERSLMTIQCIESRLASSDTSWATSDSVISAVLALICYNFSNLDFDQAVVHIRGIWMVIEARGGISTVENNQDLFLMVSWVDITAALLHNTNPLFPLPMRMDASVRPGLSTLPDPLFCLLDGYALYDERFLAVLACMGDLNSLATFLRTGEMTQGDAIWSDGEQINLLLNPIAHDLLNQQLSEPPQSNTPFEIILESLRLGAIIWIIQTKRRCRSYPGTAQTHITSLLRILSKDAEADSPWNCRADLQVVRLWLLVLCSASEPSGQDYSTLMQITVSEMKKAAEENTKDSTLPHEPQEGSNTSADAPIEPALPSTIGGVTTQKPESSDGDADLEGSSSVSHGEVISKLEDKIRVLESLLWDSSETNSVLATPHASLKRKMQEELYNPVSKKMKPASQVTLEMGSFSPEVAGRYLSVVHNEVFRVAGRAGLINPADFDVGSDGVIGLSKHALKKVYLDDKS